MKIALKLEDVLADTQARLDMYIRRLGLQDHDLWQDRLVGDNTFWAGMKAHLDVPFFLENVADNELYIFSRRPQSLYFVTRAWLRRQHIECAEKQLVCNSLFRFDCRMLDIDMFCTTEYNEAKDFKYDRTQAVLLNRDKEPTARALRKEILHIKTLPELLELKNEKLLSPWASVKMLDGKL